MADTDYDREDARSVLILNSMISLIVFMEAPRLGFIFSWELLLAVNLFLLASFLVTIFGIIRSSSFVYVSSFGLLCSLAAPGTSGWILSVAALGGVLGAIAARLTGSSEGDATHKSEEIR